MTDEKQEFINFINPNSGADFPYLVLDAINENSYPQTPGFHVMHWHEDLHFIYVLSGSIFMKTLEENVHLSACEVLVALCTLWLDMVKICGCRCGILMMLSERECVHPSAIYKNITGRRSRFRSLRKCQRNDFFFLINCK